jgi:hypothetical protein
MEVLMRFLAVFVAFGFLTGSALAQRQPSLEPDGNTRVRVGIHGITILPVTGKPFSGSDSIEWTRTLEDGSVVAMHQDASLARDGQGRIYRENVTRFAANTGQKSRVKEFIIFDPVAHTRTECAVATRHCHVNDYHVPSSLSAQPARLADSEKGSVSRENLGTDTIDGLSVTGTRETLTIGAGVEGNNQPLLITEESWYSAELEVNLSVTRKDPREGTVAIRVVDLSCSEPDPVLFQVPTGFVVEDHRQSAKSGN